MKAPKSKRHKRKAVPTEAVEDKFTQIPTPGLPGLEQVRLYDSTITHIAEHAEFKFPEDKSKLVEAIGSTERMHMSTTDPEHSVVLVSNAFTFEGNPVHVPVKLVSGASGRVKSAYFVGDTYSGKLLWKADSE